MKRRTKARSCKLVLFLLLFPVHSLAESPYCKLCLSEERQLLAEYERNRHNESVRAKISREIELLRKLRSAHRKEKPESCPSLPQSPAVFTAGFADGSEAVFAANVDVLTFEFSGFLRPLENLPMVNRANAGQSIPVRFSLGGDRGLDIVPGYPRSEQIVCSSGASVNGVDATATAGARSLSYDPATDQYTYAWRTAKAWANTCRQLVVRLLDGSVHRANFTFK